MQLGEQGFGRDAFFGAGLPDAAPALAAKINAVGPENGGCPVVLSDGFANGLVK